MPDDVRRLTAEEQPAAFNLGAIAFGYADRTMPADWSSDTPGRHTWGGFEQGRLVAKAVDREQGHWFGGRLVPACGVAGVAVEAEQRGRGLARRVLTRLLGGARERGGLVSTLFPTTPFPYRALGWEVCGAQTWTALPSATIAGIKVPQGLSVRPAVEADVANLQRLYRDLARAGTAMLDRGGPAWSGERGRYLPEYDGVTVAEDDDGIVGYASWDREPGYRATGCVTVDDFVSTTPEATLALLAMLGGWSAVAPTIKLKLSIMDCVTIATAGLHASVDDRRPWMLRIVDAPGAIAARGWSPHLRGEVDLELDDPECPWNAGAYRLVLDQGEARLERGGTGGAARLGPRGFALWYAGAATPDLLRRTGLLTGDASGDALLAVATAGPAAQLLDYF
jgi:predicted acetyltransferase